MNRKTIDFDCQARSTSMSTQMPRRAPARIAAVVIRHRILLVHNVVRVDGGEVDLYGSSRSQSIGAMRMSCDR